LKPRPSSPSIQFDNFYSYVEIERFLQGLVEAFPGLTRLGSIGQSQEGRDIHLLTLTDFTTGSPEERPAYVIHGGIHAHEPASAHGPLYTAKQLLEDYVQDGLLSRISFYILPRLCIDASEFCVATSARIRSRTDFSNRESNCIYPEDVDGDGLILTLRQQHPDGEHVADTADPRLLIQRQADSVGPYYRTFPEGYINNWDGSDQIRPAGLHAFLSNNPDFVGGRSFDWNRNWSYGWRPEGEQQGAGDYPFSELEMGHFAQFLHSHPKIFGMLGYHCGAASILRTNTLASSAPIDADDDIAMEELAQIGAELTGSPALPLAKVHWSRRRDVYRSGHALDFAYHHLGIFGFEIELGSVMNAAGFTTEDFLSWTNQEDADQSMRRLMEWWDSRGAQDPLFEPWRSFNHPQLGPVELGGFLYTALDNPLVSDLFSTLEGAYHFTVAHAHRHPWVVVEDLCVDCYDTNVYRVRLRVANRGKLPTHLTNKGKSLHRFGPVKVSFVPADGLEMLSVSGHQELGQLSGVTGNRIVEWFVAARDKSDTDAKMLGELRVSGGTASDLRSIIKIP